MAARLRFMPGGSGWAPIVDVAGYAAQRRLVRPITLSLPAGVEAALMPRRARLPLLLLGAHAPPDWKNVSVAHELGHLTLHQGPAGVPHPRSTSRRTEWEADQFAVELLLPDVLVARYALNAHGRIDDVAARLVVPPAVLRRRLRELSAARTPS
ncbi:MAG: ImmA/IrrE family metallo-endopeptidase [Chloroflexi bacterium]|nr:ImmA/IrrE family metallo-endopeptidase [Chloroflexota bacterium]